MPLYDYKCTNCNHAAEEYRKIASESRVEPCPECTALAYTRQVSLPHTDMKEFHDPIEMFSIAMEDPEEIRRFKQACPDVDLCDDPRSEMYGIPVARHRKAKIQALKHTGYVETNSERVR